MQYATARYNQNKQNQWACASIGSDKDNAKENLEYIGDQENQTTQTTGQSTIQKHTTETQDENS